MLLLLFMVFSCIVQAQVPNYAPTEGLVAWYPFNGNANDESGNGNDGEINGATLTEDEHDNSNSAYYFDGNDRIDIPHQNDFDWSAMTFVIVYQDYDNPNAVPNGNSTLVSKQPSSGWGSGWGFSTGDQNTEFGRCMTTTSGNECLGWGENEWGDWKMVAYTHSIDSVKVYFDGSLVSAAAALGGFISNSLPITIGMRGNGWVQFVGSISLIGMWNRTLTEEEVATLYNAELPFFGCTESTACNFNPEANSNDGTCISCETLATACGEGTIWDSNTSSCIVANPTDTDLDGCTGVGDVLEVLSTFGQCYNTWACGDLHQYQGYDYSTVLIGEQCWFAENLRSGQYSNGDAILTGLSQSDWIETNDGAACAQEDDESNIEEFGLLYNFFAVSDERSVCPNGWHVPSDEEWMEMEMTLGMSENDADSTGWRGTDQGTQMKTNYGWNNGGNGMNSSGFSGLPGGYRTSDFGVFFDAGESALLWSSSPNGSSSAWYRGLADDKESIKRSLVINRQAGFSVRCLWN
ncbi:hypothetical protein N9L83_02990 [Flavobacteriales bacterium]|nr:hypothetical protein [Flavobacteriales bacterium]